MLSDRLFKIASLINKDDVIYDVGTDHGLLPCYLIKNNLCKKAYAIDNKQGPLNACIENINKYDVKDKVIPIFSNGLDDIKDDVTCVIMAGIGFYTLLDIINNKDISKIKRFIIQINQNITEFRKYLSNHQYKILNEEIVYEDGHFYIIIEFSPEHDRELTIEEQMFGPILLKKRDEIFIKYLQNQKDMYTSINLKYFDENNSHIIDTIDRIIEG